MKKTGTGRYGNGIFPIIHGIMGWIRVTNRETSLGPITGGNKGGGKILLLRVDQAVDQQRYAVFL